MARILALPVMIIFVAALTLQIPNMSSGGGGRQRPVWFRTMVKDSMGGSKQEGYYVITSQKDWEKLQSGFENSGFYSYSLNFSDLDFEHRMVIAAFQGMRGSSGYEIEITKLVEYENKLEVFIQEKLPGEGMATLTVITSPCHVIEAERVDKEVVFNVVKVGRGPQPMP